MRYQHTNTSHQATSHRSSGNSSLRAETVPLLSANQTHLLGFAGRLGKSSSALGGQIRAATRCRASMGRLTATLAGLVVGMNMLA